MLLKFKLFWLVLLALGMQKDPDPIPWTGYNAWTDTGMHLMMADPGTPDNFDDDIIADWETDRRFKITILDNY